MQPEAVTEDVAARARDDVKRKKNPPLLDAVRFETYDEGESAQIFRQPIG